MEPNERGTSAQVLRMSANQAADEIGRVTIAGHPSDDLAPGTFNSI
jgi:hypothetical protein